MRECKVYLLGEPDAYGQSTIIKDENGEPVIQGTVQMSINVTSQSIQDNINYHNANYIGLTHSRILTDKNLIIDERISPEPLKVLYVNPMGRYCQVFLGTI